LCLVAPTNEPVVDYCHRIAAPGAVDAITTSWDGGVVFRYPFNLLGDWLAGEIDEETFIHVGIFDPLRE
jgi:hypothetical protein